MINTLLPSNSSWKGREPWAVLQWVFFPFLPTKQLWSARSILGAETYKILLYIVTTYVNLIRLGYLVTDIYIQCMYFWLYRKLQITANRLNQYIFESPILCNCKL